MSPMLTIEQNACRCLRLFNAYLWKQSSSAISNFSEQEEGRLIKLLRELAPKTIGDFKSHYQSTDKSQMGVHGELYEKLGSMIRIIQATINTDNFVLSPELSKLPMPMTAEFWLQAIGDFVAIRELKRKEEITSLLNGSCELTAKCENLFRRSSNSVKTATLFTLISPFAAYFFEVSSPVTYLVGATLLTGISYLGADVITDKFSPVGKLRKLPFPEVIIEMIETLGEDKTVQFLKKETERLSSILQSFSVEKRRSAAIYSVGSVATNLMGQVTGFFSGGQNLMLNNGSANFGINSTHCFYLNA